MTTMLDCIIRTAPTVTKIIDSCLPSTDRLASYLGENVNSLDELVLVGSGSSYNSIVAALPFLEKVTGLQAHAYVPNNFAAKSVYNPNALYIFVSQSGTSTLVKNQVIRMNESGYLTVSVTDDAESPISKTAGVNVEMGVGGEEFGYRTVGFTSSVVILQMIALRIGLERKHITAEELDAYLKDGRKAAANHPAIVEKTLKWFSAHKEELKPLKSLMYYGGGVLYGMALEGALKLMETPKLYLSGGFEAEDGIHGPCYAFGKGDAIICLNDGERDVDYAEGMARFSKNELGLGFMFGPKVLDENDLQFDLASKDFRQVEFSPAVQVVAYQMAVINDVPVLDSAHRIPHVSGSYYQTHKG